MRKKVFVIVVAVLMLFAFAGCSKVVETVRQVMSGDVNGEIGKSYSTQWFDFTVLAVDEESSYAGYEPAPGYRLIVVYISETGAFDEPVPMGTYDFYMDADTFYDYMWPLDPFDDAMMPLEFDLPKGVTVRYDMVYEIPEVAPNLKLLYTEFDETDREGATFTIKLDL